MNSDTLFADKEASFWHRTKSVDNFESREAIFCGLGVFLKELMSQNMETLAT